MFLYTIQLLYLLDTVKNGIPKQNLRMPNVHVSYITKVAQQILRPGEWVHRAIHTLFNIEVCQNQKFTFPPHCRGTHVHGGKQVYFGNSVSGPQESPWLLQALLQFWSGGNETSDIKEDMVRSCDLLNTTIRHFWLHSKLLLDKTFAIMYLLRSVRNQLMFCLLKSQKR